MKIRTRWIFTIILCLLIAISLAACDGSPAAPNGTLESKNGVTVEGTFADGAALEAVEVVGEDKLVALQSIAEENYYTDGKVYVYDIATPLTFEDKAEYDVPSTVYGGDVAYSSVALSASGGSGDYVFSVVSAADGNTKGVGIISTETDLNKIYVNPNIRGVSEATEITVRVKDKGGYSTDVTVRIGEVAAPTYSATVVPWISAR